MNRTEAAYAERLTSLQLSGDIAGFDFEPLTLRLAPKTSYCPDFLVQLPDGTLAFHEVKACGSAGQYLAEDASRIKIKVAAEKFGLFEFWFAGKLPKKLGGGWKFERVG